MEECWLLLLIAADGCCCWLLLLVAAVDCLCWLPMLIVEWLLVAARILLVGRKFIEFFRDIDDLRLSYLCRRKSLWIFSGYWWFAARTILQAKKSLNIFRILMRGKRKRVSPRRNRLVDGSKQMNFMGVHWVFIPEWSRVLSVLRESQ